ncbi:MAG: EAL domain-containing protein [Pseudomonadota bacterium]
MGAQAVRLSNLDIDKALKQREFEVLFQPIFDLSNGALARFECFVRWRHETLGLLPPGAFISFFETQGRMSELTRLVLETALDGYMNWRGPYPPGFSINLAQSDLADSAFASVFTVALRAHGLSPKLVTLECPMPPIDQPLDVSIAQFKRLSATGARLAIEVRGRANEFLRQVTPFPFDEIKTGGPAILRFARTVRGPGLSAISELLELAGETSAAITAVGVEDQTSLAALRSLGFAAAQGNHLAKVGPLNAFKPSRINEVRDLLGLDRLSRDDLTGLFRITPAYAAAQSFGQSDSWDEDDGVVERLQDRIEQAPAAALQNAQPPKTISALPTPQKLSELPSTSSEASSEAPAETVESDGEGRLVADQSPEAVATSEGADGVIDVETDGVVAADANPVGDSGANAVADKNTDEYTGKELTTGLSDTDPANDEPPRANTRAGGDETALALIDRLSEEFNSVDQPSDDADKGSDAGAPSNRGDDLKSDGANSDTLGSGEHVAQAAPDGSSDEAKSETSGAAASDAAHPKAVEQPRPAAFADDAQTEFDLDAARDAQTSAHDVEATGSGDSIGNGAQDDELPTDLPAAEAYERAEARKAVAIAPWRTSTSQGATTEEASDDASSVSVGQRATENPKSNPSASEQPVDGYSDRARDNTIAAAIPASRAPSENLVDDFTSTVFTGSRAAKPASVPQTVSMPVPHVSAYFIPVLLVGDIDGVAPDNSAVEDIEAQTASADVAAAKTAASEDRAQTTARAPAWETPSVGEALHNVEDGVVAHEPDGDEADAENLEQADNEEVRKQRKKNILTRKYHWPVQMWRSVTQPPHFWPKSWRRAWRRRAEAKRQERAVRNAAKNAENQPDDVDAALYDD